MNDAFRTILDMSLTASTVILVVLGGRFLLRKLPKVFSYALWSVVLFRLLCPVSISAPVSVVQLSQPQVVAQSEVTSSISYFTEVKQVQTIVPSEETPEPSQQKPGISLVDAASWIWGAGVLAMAGYGIYSFFKLRLQLVGAVEYQRGIYIADHIPSAFVLGLFRPKIYLPTGLYEQERTYILAHENCHIRRGDHVIKVLAYAALCLHWFNPLVWLAFKLAGKDMEMSCDEAVLKKLGAHLRGDYAQVLLQQTIKGRKSLAILFFGQGDTRGRVLNMVNWKKPKPLIIVISLVLCAILVTVCALNPSKPKSGFGVWMGEGEYENLTQESYTGYLQQAYGLSQVIDHRVYYQDGFFQVDMQFEKNTQDWQWGSGKNFAVDKFYHRNIAQYDLYDYDVWLMEHLEEHTQGLLYRCFVGDKLQMVLSYPEQTFQADQKLKLTVHPGGQDVVKLEKEDLNGAFSDGMTYLHIKAVDITLDDSTMPLEAALKNGILTAEELFSLARMDAQSGICQQVLDSNQGVSGYTFQYENYSLLWVNDLYETPSAEPYPIAYAVIYPPSNSAGTVIRQQRPSGRVLDLETGLYNDREDWGLSFAVKEATPTSVTLHCIQSGGQQVGALTIVWSLLSDGSWPVDRIIHEDNTPWLDIPMDQESELTIDWSSICAEKQPGNYTLELYVQDVYDPEQIHPLIDKVHDIQQYEIVFTIP